MATQHKTASTHRSAIVRGAHQLDIVGYNTRRKFGTDNTVRSRSFDTGGFVWALVCRFVANPTQARGLTLASVSLELSRNHTDEDIVTMASVRIDDPTGCGRYPAAEWHSAEPHTFPAWSYQAVAWELSVPDAFLEHEERYVMDDCLTIHCAVDVVREECADGATRNYSVVVPPPPSLSQDIHRLREEMWWPDVTFVVDQTKIQAHKLVLAMRSPVFAAQFHGEMKEKTMRCLRIDDMSASTFKAMIHFVYTDELPKPKKGACHLAMARDLLVAADLYDLERLRLMCENMLSKSITVGNVMTTLMLVHNRHSCRQLEASCVEFIASDPDLYNAVQATDEYKELEEACPSFMYEITKKVATCAVARNKSPSTSSADCCTDDNRESASRYNPSAVMIGTHEFRIESWNAVRKTHSVGQYIQSGSFQVGGCKWAIEVFPSVYAEGNTEYIGLFVKRLIDGNDNGNVNDDNDNDDDDDDDDDDEYEDEDDDDEDDDDDNDKDEDNNVVADENQDNGDDDDDEYEDEDDDDEDDDDDNDKDEDNNVVADENQDNGDDDKDGHEGNDGKDVKALLTFKIEDPTGKLPACQNTFTHVYADGVGDRQGCSNFITAECANSHYVRHDGSLTVQCRVEVTTTFCTSGMPVSDAVIHVPVPPFNLALHLEQLLASESGWDVKFLVEDSEIHAHGLVVATRSPALHEQVESATGIDHVKVDGMSATVFKAMLHFIYTDELPRVDDLVPAVGSDSTMMAGETLAAACRFRLERMKRLCENLLAENITPENALATLRIAGRHGCAELEGHCVEYMLLPHVAKDVMNTLKSFL